jgi:Mg2+ and Co2+ transporter CorA
MSLLENVFSEVLQRNYRQHDRIQRNEDEKLRKIQVGLKQIDELAEAFEQRMDLAASEMEQWILKNKNNEMKK